MPDLSWLNGLTAGVVGGIAQGMIVMAGMGLIFAPALDAEGKLHPAGAVGMRNSSRAQG